MVVHNLMEALLVTTVTDAVHDKTKEKDGREADAEDPGVVEDVDGEDRRDDDHEGNGPPAACSAPPAP